MKLITKRLILRTYKKEDLKENAEELASLLNDYLVSRYTSHIPYPYHLKDAKNFIKKQLKEAVKRKKEEIVFAIFLKENKKLIGTIGLHKINRKNKQAEIGYWLGRAYWNKGIMTEAVSAVLGFAFRKLGLHRICAKTFIANKPSQKVLVKVGFRREGILRGDLFKNKRFFNSYIFGILEKEYKKNKN